MSELQLALIAVAGLVLLALYGHGKWQERRLLRRMRAALHGGVEDALLRSEPPGDPGGEAGRAEPGWDAVAAGDPLGDPSDGAAAAHGAAAAQAPVELRAAQLARELAARSGPEEVVSEPLRLPAAAVLPDWAEDPMLDCALELRCARAVDGVAVIDAAAALAAEPFSLPVHFVVWDARHEQWVLPDRFGYYNDALAAIQLAGRGGALTADEFARFLARVREVAGALQADVDAPDAERLLAQARELDAVCARYDIRIGLTVISTGIAAWTAPQVRSAAQEAGFASSGPQRWVAADASGTPLVTLAAESPLPRRLVLELDVPLVPVEAGGLTVLIEHADALARVLGGRVVDDNGRPVDAASMGAVQAQLAQVHEEMTRAGIEPGGARARRLYG